MMFSNCIHHVFVYRPTNSGVYYPGVVGNGQLVVKLPGVRRTPARRPHNSARFRLDHRSVMRARPTSGRGIRVMESIKAARRFLELLAT